jgi:quercetin dioxygenase-like cupin family protein
MALAHAKPGEKIHLTSVASGAWTARATALVKTDRFETAQLLLRAGETIPAHQVAGHVTLMCLEGSVTLQIGNPVELGPGDWIYLERGQPHALAAHADSSLVLTILFDR